MFTFFTLKIQWILQNVAAHLHLRWLPASCCWKSPPFCERLSLACHAHAPNHSWSVVGSTQLKILKWLKKKYLEVKVTKYTGYNNFKIGWTSAVGPGQLPPAPGPRTRPTPLRAEDQLCRHSRWWRRARLTQQQQPHSEVRHHLRWQEDPGGSGWGMLSRYPAHPFCPLSLTVHFWL